MTLIGHRTFVICLAASLGATALTFFSVMTGEQWLTAHGIVFGLYSTLKAKGLTDPKQ